MLTIGAVAYDPKVVTIWEGFCAWFAQQGLPTDYLLYRTYERQVEGHLRGEVDLAWNSPLAWIQTERKAASFGRRAYGVAMRDTDQDLTSVILVRSEGPLHALTDLAGQTVAVGASDSPQATLIPLGMLHRAGVQVKALPFEVMVGKHGDHVGGERDAVRALLDGRAHAACVLDANLVGFTRDGTLPPDATRVLGRSPPFDHCLFTAIAGRKDSEVGQLGELLLGMSFEDPVVRPLLELEGLRQWRRGRQTGFGPLNQAIDELSFDGAAQVRAFVST